MTVHTFTREELYNLVWQEPIRTIARRLNVSDVGLAKACRRAEIPVPQRGYWAKLQHNKPVAREPLPESMTADKVAIAQAAPKPALSKEAHQILQTERTPNVPTPDDLERAHPAVATWVRENEKQRRQYRREGWGTRDLIDFDEPLQQRRLRLYSALFSALAASGLKMKAGRTPEDWSTAGLDDQTVEFRIYVRARQVRRPLTDEEKQWSWNADRRDTFNLVGAGDLVLKVKTYTRGAMPDGWRENKVKLEDQLGEAVLAFHAGLAELKAWRAEQEEQREQYRQAERRRADEARLARERETWREALVAAAAGWRRSQDIREMVAALEATPRADEEGFCAWRDEALDTALRLDPVLSGTLTLHLPSAFATRT